MKRDPYFRSEKIKYSSASQKRTQGVEQTQVESHVSSDTSSSMNISDGLRYRGIQHQTVPSSMSNMATGMNSVPGSMPNLSQWYHFHHQQQQQQQQQMPQYHWPNQYQMQMQHMQQYYQQMQQWQMMMNGGQWQYQHSSSPLSSPVSTPGTPSSPLPQQNNMQQAPQPAPEAAAPAAGNIPNENLRMNAGIGGGMVQGNDDGNENQQNRDWLDWLYMSMRVLMLLSIIYFYSSTSRFLLVALLGFILYVYQAGWFTPRRRVPQPGPNMEEQPPQQEREQPQNNEQDSSSDHVDNPPDNNDNEDGSHTNSATETVVVRPGFFRVLCTFFVSFITSIIPTAPPAIQQQ